MSRKGPGPTPLSPTDSCPGEGRQRHLGRCAITLFLAMIGAVTAAQGATATIPSDLEAAVKAYDRAQTSGDRNALMELLAEDYLLVNGAGEVETKAEFIAESVDPTFKLDPFTVLNAVNRVWNHGAVLAGEVYLSGTSGGRLFNAHTRFADIWAKRAGRWQVVFTEVTRIPAKQGDAK